MLEDDSLDDPDEERFPFSAVSTSSEESLKLLDFV
jgi:hypothetical protein